LSTAENAVGFERDIKPLFRERDRDSMMRMFDLWSYDDVRTNSEAIVEALEEGRMPCDGAWPADQVGLVRSWIEAGMAP
jgi:hypothetical protein